MLVLDQVFGYAALCYALLFGQEGIFTYHTSLQIATKGLFRQGYLKVGAGDSLFGQYWTYDLF